MTGIYAGWAVLLDNDGHEIHRMRVEQLSVNREMTLGGIPVKTTIDLSGWVSEKDLVVAPKDRDPFDQGTVAGLLRTAGGEATFSTEDMTLRPNEEIVITMRKGKVTLRLEKS